MADGFECSLVTPEQALFEGTVTYANLPAHDGQLGVQKGHAPLLVQLGTGELDMTLPGGAHRKFDLSGGFAQVLNDRLTLLSESATERE